MTMMRLTPRAVEPAMKVVLDLLGVADSRPRIKTRFDQVRPQKLVRLSQATATQRR